LALAPMTWVDIAAGIVYSVVLVGFWVALAIAALY
jgi:tetrahydromethanopterin S-methyltransferase subunit F